MGTGLELEPIWARLLLGAAPPSPGWLPGTGSGPASLSAVAAAAADASHSTGRVLRTGPWLC